MLTLAVISIERVLHGKKIVQYFQDCKRQEVDKGYSKVLQVTPKKGDQKVRLVFKDHWISSCFYYLNLHFGEKCETKLLRKPTEVSQNPPTFISIGLPDTKKKIKHSLCFLAALLFQKKIAEVFNFSYFKYLGKDL